MVIFLFAPVAPVYPAIHMANGTRTVGNVVQGAIPKQTMETSPSRTARMTLRLSLMPDFKHSQNCKEIQAII